MTPKEYSELALRTAAGRNYPLNMYEAGMGIGGEGGEIVDIIKKIAFYNKDIDKDHIKEELGDLLWYVNLMLHSIGATWEDVFDLNIKKLEARYPDLRFNADHAINRDVNAEQKAMFAKALNEGNESTNHSWVDAEDEAASMSTGAPL